MKRTIAGLLLFSIVGVACGERATDERTLLDFVRDLETKPHELEYREVSGGREIVVRGRIEDDFRRYGMLWVDGREVAEYIVSDDALAVRLVDPDHVEGLDLLEDSVAIDALRRGRWVIDHTMAPPLFPETTREGSIATGLGPFLDAAYVLTYLRRGINEGAEIEEHNPDDPQYQPVDDPFSDITEEELSRSQGYRRFDVLPPGLPTPAARGTEAAVPAPPQFRRIAFFVKGERIVKVLELVSFDRPEFRRARAGRASDFYLRLEESVRAGGTSEPVRLRSMEYNVLQLGRRLPVEVPLEEAVAGSLAGFLDLMADRAPAPTSPTLPSPLPDSAPPEDEEGPTDDVPVEDEG